MGIGYYSCDACGQVTKHLFLTFPDVCSYSCCQDRGSYLCGSCIDEYGVGHSLMSVASLEAEEDQNEFDLCPLCPDDIITDDVLLAFAIEMLDTTKEKLIEEYLKDV